MDASWPIRRAAANAIERSAKRGYKLSHDLDDGVKERILGTHMGWQRALAKTSRWLAVRLTPASVGLLIARVCLAGVLSQSDLNKVETLRPMFASLMGDLVQTSKRSDISAVDADCVKSTIQDLLEISQELSSYEYLITIERELTEADDNDPTRDVVKFAIDQSTNILASQRKRIAQLPDQCARSALAMAKAQQALQVVDTTAGILSSIRSRL